MSKAAANGSAEPGHSIKIVSQRTGLSSHVIRVWERRYGAVTPRRTETNRRLYSDDDVDRLRLLAEATEIGHAIGNIANLSDDELRRIIDEDRGRIRRHDPAPGGDPEPWLEEALQAASDLDADGLRSVLERAATQLPQIVVLQNLVVPLMTRIGERWHDGSLRVAHEHTAYAAVSAFVSALKTSYTPSGGAPVLVVATPSGQIHELGALIAATTAASEGWSTAYLGASLPVEEIVNAVDAHDARAVALSIVYPHDDPSLEEELRKLRRLLPDDVDLVVGGRAAGGYTDVLNDLGARIVHDLISLRNALGDFRG